MNELQTVDEVILPAETEIGHHKHGMRRRPRRRSSGSGSGEKAGKSQPESCRRKTRDSGHNISNEKKRGLEHKYGPRGNDQNQFGDDTRPKDPKPERQSLEGLPNIAEEPSRSTFRQLNSRERRACFRDNSELTFVLASLRYLSLNISPTGVEEVDFLTIFLI